jgi:glutamate dehydrogenase (NADP+)
VFAQRMLATRGRSFDGARVLVSGSGNVALYAIQKVHQLGGTVVACSDSSGVVYDRDGIDFELLRRLKEVERARLSEYAARRAPSAEYRANGDIWALAAETPIDVAIPCATQNELDGTAAATLAGNGVAAVVEGANMPCTPEAVHVLRAAGVLFAPGKAANAGGVATSALEMQQNASRDAWTFEYAEQRLDDIMTAIHDSCAETAERYGAPGDYVLGANVAGFVRVADAMLALGVI